ncbi:MAG: lysophospholipase [Phycisphaerae bacterium]|nr:lysophospholipase [Phycisphaerae bacterium]
MRPLFVLLPAWVLVAAAGCADGNKPFMTADRMNRGLMVILPGIEGESGLNHDIRRGLINGGLMCAMPIQSWGRPVPLAGPLLNQMDIIGNRIAAAGIADMIADYQTQYPDRPVYVVGHSGGGGIAVFVAEALPKDVMIDGLVLLSASMSSAYDITKALGHCRKGVLNIYSKADVGLLIVGTVLAGNVDGIRGPATGAIGFDRPSSRSSAERVQAYQKLFQLELTSAHGSDDAHGSTTRRGFVSRYVAPWLTATSWPPPETPGMLSTQAATP